MLAIPAPVLFLVSACIAMFVLVRQGTLGQLGAGLQRVEPATIGMALLLTAIGLGLLAMRWWMLVRMAGGDVAPPVAADVFLTSVILNYAAPIGLAAPARAALSKRDLGLSVTGSGGVVLWEALLDLGTLALVGCLWLALGGAAAVRVLLDSGQSWLRTVAGVIVVVFVIAIGVLVASRAIRDKARRFAIDASRFPRQEPGWAAFALGTTLVYWLLQGVLLNQLLIGFGIPQPGLELVFGLLGWPVFLGMVSPAPGGAGVREALMVAVAGLVRVDGAIVLLAALAYRIAMLLMLPVLYLLARLWRSRWKTATASLVEDS